MKMFWWGVGGGIWEYEERAQSHCCQSSLQLNGIAGEDVGGRLGQTTLINTAQRRLKEGLDMMGHVLEINIMCAVNSPLGFATAPCQFSADFHAACEP